MQLSGNSRQKMHPSKRSAVATGRRLSDLRRGEAAVIGGIDLPHDIAVRLMELGFVPGASVTVSASAPWGDPRVFRVDGSEIALRTETAFQMWVQDEPPRQ